MSARIQHFSRPFWSYCVTAIVLLCGTAAGGAEVQRALLEDRSLAVLTPDLEIFVESLPERGEGLLAFSRRLCGSTGCARTVEAINGGAAVLEADRSYRVPFGLLRPDLQLQVVRALFSADLALPAGWRHRVAPRAGATPESLWRISEWFTGAGDNYKAIREFNELFDDDLRPQQEILVPAALLRPAFRAILPETSDHVLEFGSDGLGEFASYRLKAGEALYSSVVVRFTGSVYAEDVNLLAAKIARRSGIADVTDIPIGYQVKIPIDSLVADFLPVGHPRRREYEASRLASSKYSNRVSATRLQGVTVVLDAGHGGKDVGASMNGVWESLYVYDIMLRTRHLLEQTTAAAVISTTQEGSSFEVVERDVLGFSKGHRVLTTPNYPIEDSNVGVNLRWYLSNSIFKQATKSGTDQGKLIFVSIHADSLHPSLRGAMVYVPGAAYRGGSYGKSGVVYASRKEFSDRPRVSFTRQQLVRSEGLSRDLAKNLVGSLSRQGLAIHPDQPIREKVIRNGKAWVPAVLRYNEVPASILLETCNLANSEDRALIQTRKFRQQMAEAIVQGILDYYGVAGGDSDVRVAATGG